MNVLLTKIVLLVFRQMAREEHMTFLDAPAHVRHQKHGLIGVSASRRYSYHELRIKFRSPMVFTTRAARIN